MIPRFATPVFRPVRATLFVTLGCFGLYSFVTIISHHWSSLFSSQQPPWWCFPPSAVISHHWSSLFSSQQPPSHQKVCSPWPIFPSPGAGRLLLERWQFAFFYHQNQEGFSDMIWMLMAIDNDKGSIVPICLYQLKSFPATNRIHGIWWGKLHLRSFSLWNQVFCRWQSNSQAGTKTL